MRIVLFVPMFWLVRLLAVGLLLGVRLLCGVWFECLSDP